MNHTLIVPLILGLGALGAGLGALKLNLLQMLGLSPIARALKLICGVAGIVALHHIFTNCECIQASQTPMQFYTLIVLVITNIGVGISGLGANVLRGLHLEAIQKPLQLVAGAAGVCALVKVAQMLAQ